MKRKIFITGGAGYVGSRLVPYLLKKNYSITVYDAFFYGNFLKKSKNLKIIKGDIRNKKLLKKTCKNHDIFLHLACISNDASFELNKKLSKSINYDCFESIVLIAKKNGIKKFIYASSSSVYGISKKRNITEESPLVPITYYNKYKAMCEPLLLKHTDSSFIGVIFRPATVCGYSPRMRFDLSVNILTNFAYNKGFIKVFGGKQLRPNLHILDYCRVVDKLIVAKDDKIVDQIFNVGHQNRTILNIANLVKKIVQKKLNNKILVKITKSNDKRSYHINSKKIERVLNFKPIYSIEDAINEIITCFKKRLIDKSFDNDNFFNIKVLKKKFN
jgi:nucleoside-diphosphate-sugar epimerase